MSSVAADWKTCWQGARGSGRAPRPRLHPAPVLRGHEFSDLGNDTIQACTTCRYRLGREASAAAASCTWSSRLTVREGGQPVEADDVPTLREITTP